MGLLNSSANPNILGTDGRTPLHLAIEQKSPTSINFLLNAKANVNITSQQYPISPLQLAQTIPEIYQIFASFANNNGNLGQNTNVVQPNVNEDESEENNEESEEGEGNSEENSEEESEESGESESE